MQITGVISYFYPACVCARREQVSGHNNIVNFGELAVDCAISAYGGKIQTFMLNHK